MCSLLAAIASDTGKPHRVAAEFFSGLALALGLLARPAAQVDAIAMAVALFWANPSYGLFASNKG